VKRLLRTAIRAGMRQGWRRGVREGNQVWVVVGGIALLGHLAGRALGRKEETVFKEMLKPGQSFRITHLPKP
jgi:hypothetical protein